MNTVGNTDVWTPQPYRVLQTTPETADIVTLTLAPADSEIPTHQPGQFNMLYSFGVGEVAISLSGDAEDKSHFVHTIRNVGAISAALTSLQPGHLVGVRGPFGSAWPLSQAERHDVVLVAGGLGLAPLRPAIYHLLAHRDLYGHVAILVGNRSPTQMLYQHELQHWRSYLDVQLEVTVDHAEFGWHGHVGVVPSLLSRVEFNPASTLAMVCGPEIMMRFTINALRNMGVATDHIYVSMERNMKCAIGLCGHCQFGPHFICKDGPVMRFDRIANIFSVREV